MASTGPRKRTRGRRLPPPPYVPLPVDNGDLTGTLNAPHERRSPTGESGEDQAIEDQHASNMAHISRFPTAITLPGPSAEVNVSAMESATPESRHLIISRIHRLGADTSGRPRALVMTGPDRLTRTERFLDDHLLPLLIKYNIRIVCASDGAVKVYSPRNEASVAELRAAIRAKNDEVRTTRARTGRGRATMVLSGNPAYGYLVGTRPIPGQRRKVETIYTLDTRPIYATGPLDHGHAAPVLPDGTPAVPLALPGGTPATAVAVVRWIFARIESWTVAGVRRGGGQAPIVRALNSAGIA